MFAVSHDIKKSRRWITKTARKKLGPEKKEARRRFRSQLKAADRRYDHDGMIRPAMTKLDIT